LKVGEVYKAIAYLEGMEGHFLSQQNSEGNVRENFGYK
jgi:hypothetical protein